MLRSGWGGESVYKVALFVVGSISILVLCSLFSYGLWVQSKSQWDSDDRRYRYHAETYHPEYKTCVGLVRHAQADCVASARDAYDVNQREERDLVAQETTAAWTLVMSGAAILGVIFTLLGIFLVWVTFQETRKANAIARAQAVAYPSVDALKFELGEREGDPYRPLVRLCLKNAGNTPAFDYGVTFSLTIKVGDTVTFSGEYQANVERGRIRIDPSMPGDMFCTPDDIAFSEYVEELKSSSLKIFVSAASSYRDAFGSMVTNEDHFRSSAIYCHPNTGEPGGEYIFNIKMAKYDPERD